jgi:protein-S-isoprenylcysteine O-methyltransferase Ste14
VHARSPTVLSYNCDEVGSVKAFSPSADRSRCPHPGNSKVLIRGIVTPFIFLAALDAGRFRWSPAIPLWVYIPSFVLYATGQAIHLWAKGTNRWFATVVRIQTDRGQVVCEEGPYRFVGHPGYFGGLLFMITTPLILGSCLALIPQAAAAVSLVARTYLEDRTLQAELPGYAEYAQRVRHRLLPL